MPNKPTKILIVGGVAGGAGAAARLRRIHETAEIILFEKGEFISFANCGLPYYIGDVITNKANLLLQTPESFHSRFNVDVRVQNEVLCIDSVAKTVQVKNLVSGETYLESYDTLVLSPGAKPIVPPLKGLDTNNVFTLRNIPDTYAIKEFVQKNCPKTCAVIGAGFIGLEMAENLCKLGVQVSVVEAAPHVMAPIDTDVSHEIHNHIRSHGIALYLDSKATEITNHSVVLHTGAEVQAQMVIMSIGVSPETSFLKGSGIELGQRGEILVNEYMEASAAGVYALGDAVAVKNIVSGKQVIIPLASPANKQARIVADNIAGKKTAYKGSQGTSIVKLFDMTVAVTGEKEEALQRNEIPYQKLFTYSASHAGYYPNAKMMSLKLLFAPDDGKILGAQIVGYTGVDKRIDTLANAVRFGMTVYDLQEMELAYAPPFSSAKDPVNMAGYVGANILEGLMRPFFVEDVPEIPADGVILDVRTCEEFQQGSIARAINIPVDDLRTRVGEIPKEKPVYILCRIGQRGYIAQRILDQKGYDTYNLSGGYRLFEAVQTDLQQGAAFYQQCLPCGKPE